MSNFWHGKQSRIRHEKPIIGSPYTPCRETGMRDFGLYLWWAFCMKNLSSHLKIFGGIIILILGGLTIYIEAVPIIWIGGFIWGFGLIASGISERSSAKSDWKQSVLKETIICNNCRQTLRVPVDKQKYTGITCPTCGKSPFHAVKNCGKVNIFRRNGLLTAILSSLIIFICIGYLVYAQSTKDRPNNNISDISGDRTDSDLIISASDLAPYLSAVVEIECGDTQGSGSLWNFDGFGYSVLTNQHVLEAPSVRKNGQRVCAINLTGRDLHSSSDNQGSYIVDFDSAYGWNDITDVAAIKLEEDELINNVIKLADPKFSPTEVSSLNYELSNLRECSNDMAIGSPVAMIGYPAYTQSSIPLPEDQSIDVDIIPRTISNGIISAYSGSNDIELNYGLPNKDYFVSNKIDSGNSGGIALSKDQSGLCVLGIPTWVNLGNYDTQGVVQNIHNIFFNPDEQL